MEGPQDIVQRVIIAGHGDVVSAFEAMGEAGKKAFDSLEGVLGKVAIGLGALTVAVTGTTAAFFEWAKSSSEAAFELGHLASQAGVAVEQMSSLKSALIGMGASTENLESSLRRLGFRISNEWPKIIKQLEEAGDKSKKAALGVDEAILHAQQARAKQSAGGGALDPDLEAEFAARQRMLDVKKADLAVSEALRAKREQEAHSLPAAMNQVKATIEGVAAPFTQVQLTARETVDALIALAGNAKTLPPYIVQVGKALGEVTSPKSVDVLYKMADYFAKTTDEAKKQRIAIELLGRGFSYSLVEAMSKGGRKGLEEFQKVWEKAGLTITDSDKHVGEELVTNWRKLQEAVRIIFDQIGTRSFAPIFIEGIEKLNEAIFHNNDVFRQWGTSLATLVKPIIIDIFNLLSGHKLETPWIASLVKAFGVIKDWIMTQLFPVIRSFFQYIAGDTVEVKWVKKFLDDVNRIIDSVKALLRLLGILEKEGEPAKPAVGAEEPKRPSEAAPSLQKVGEVAPSLRKVGEVAPSYLRTVKLKPGTEEVGGGGVETRIPFGTGVETRIPFGTGVETRIPFGTRGGVESTGFGTRAGVEIPGFGTGETTDTQEKVEGLGTAAEVAARKLDLIPEPKRPVDTGEGEPTRPGQGKSGFKVISEGVAEGVKGLSELAASFSSELIEAITNAFKNVDWSNLGHAVISAFVDPIMEGFGNMITINAARFKSVFGIGIGEVISSLKEKWGAMMDDFLAKASGLWAKMKGIFSSGTGTGLLNATSAHARGGIVKGPGTGTSDSVPIMASAGEGIVRADGSNLSQIVSYFTGGGYALGGIVRAALDIPRFAGGGVVPAMGGEGGGSRYMIDLRTDAGDVTVQSTDSTAKQLNRLAREKRLVRTGRSPNWRT